MPHWQEPMRAPTTDRKIFPAFLQKTPCASPTKNSPGSPGYAAIGIINSVFNSPPHPDQIRYPPPNHPARQHRHRLAHRQSFLGKHRTADQLTRYSFAEALAPEKALNMGINLTQKFETGDENLSGYISLDYYRTSFQNQIFPDYDSDPTKAIIRNFRGSAAATDFRQN